MKIGEFTDSFIPVVDGVGRVVSAYCCELGKRDNEVYVISPMTDTGYRGKYPFEIVDFLSKALPGGLPWKQGIPNTDQHFQKRMKDISFEIVHSHSPFITGLSALRYANKYNIPIVSTFHSKYYDDFLMFTHSKMVSDIGVKAVLEYYSHCDEVWAVSSSTAAVLEDYGYSGHIEVMENGTDPLKPEECGDPDEIRRKYRIPERPVLLFVGQLNWKKNILLILEACAILKSRGERCTLILAGMGPHEDEIKDKARDLGIKSDVIFTGHVESIKELDGIYRAADIFTFPSLYDNAPMVVREAARAGTPSVLARDGSAAEIIEDGVNGRLCGNSAEDLARVISEMLSDREKLHAMGEAARKTTPIPWEKIIDKVENRYRYLIENHRPSKKFTEERERFLRHLGEAEFQE
ncbi:MAG: glycosyltransferase [Oscillospiraceae bacterium]|jgi:1,2-diacylglycerol 3-alpha-glucosyltransferase